MTRSLDFPDLKEGEYAVLVGEIATGIVHALAGGRYRGTGQRFFVASSFEEAEAFSNNRVSADARVECTIYDHVGKPAAVVRSPEWERQFGPAPPRKPWWKIW
ncbi:hypothetical protein WMF37_45620 [Sorangium sp. So ce291]|uniref:hypothetical protein n=1 Tax=Sorangium sp. So ce291 TaxID=3133294 RepID=UPI003F60FA7E